MVPVLSSLADTARPESSYVCIIAWGALALVSEIQVQLVSEASMTLTQPSGNTRWYSLPFRIGKRNGDSDAQITNHDVHVWHGKRNIDFKRHQCLVLRGPTLYSSIPAY